METPLFTFASPDAADEWRVVNDDVMGGVSAGRLRLTDDGTLEFTGTLSLANGGGFASVRSRPRQLGLAAGDALAVRLRGDGRTWQLNLYTAGRTTGQSHRTPVDTRDGEWIEARIPLDRFEATSFGRAIAGAGPVDPGAVTAIGFLLGGREPGPFHLEVGWIRVVRGPRGG